MFTKKKDLEKIKGLINLMNYGNDIENMCPSIKELIFYPVNFGLTGYCFRSGTI
jgi:hypothetical protein